MEKDVFPEDEFVNYVMGKLYGLTGNSWQFHHFDSINGTGLVWPTKYYFLDQVNLNF